jgi:hypothetical protein
MSYADMTEQTASKTVVLGPLDRHWRWLLAAGLHRRQIALQARA